MSCSLCRPRACKGHEVRFGAPVPDVHVQLARTQALCAAVYQILGSIRLADDTVPALDLLHAAASGELRDADPIGSLLPFYIKSSHDELEFQVSALEKEVQVLRITNAIDRVKISSQKFEIKELRARGGVF